MNVQYDLFKTLQRKIDKNRDQLRFILINFIVIITDKVQSIFVIE